MAAKIVFIIVDGIHTALIFFNIEKCIKKKGKTKLNICEPLLRFWLSYNFNFT